MSKDSNAEQILGYVFKDKGLLKRALTHSGYRQGEANNYQRLEYLGDALLDFAVAERLFNKFPNYDEGKLTKLRAAVVSKEPLSKIAEQIGLVDCIYYDPATTGLSDKLKSDVFESAIAAIYLDSGDINTAKDFIYRTLGKLIDSGSYAVTDYKSLMYEYASANKKSVEFVLDQTQGPAHSLIFNYTLKLDGVEIASASGHTKRAAQQECSEIAYKKLGLKESE